MIYYEDLRTHPHEQQYIEEDITIRMRQERIKYKIFTATYYNGSHFIQRVRRRNSQIIMYNGMEDGGRAQQIIEQAGREFPSSFIGHNQQLWSVYSVWFERVEILPNMNNDEYGGQDNLPPIIMQDRSDIIELTDEISQSPIKVQKRDDRSNSTAQNKNKTKDIKKKNHKNKINDRRNKTVVHNVDSAYNYNSSSRHLHDSQNCSGISVHNVDSVDNNNISSSSHLSVSLNCSSISVHNASPNPNSLAYIQPLPPPALVLLRSDAEDQTLKRPREENLIRHTKKNKGCSDTSVPPPSLINERRPIGCCSPGTAEGRSGQG
jgi:hypothetical protein